MLRGIVYRNSFVYNLLTRIKFGKNADYRFILMSQNIIPGEHVLDLCAGFGRLQEFLPPQCQYTMVDGSHSFITQAKRKNKDCIKLDLRHGLPLGDKSYDVVVMMISLYEFRDAQLSTLLRDCQRVARRKVLFLEEVMLDESTLYDQKFRTGLRNYLCYENKGQSGRLFTYHEFEQHMLSHHYKVERHSDIYAWGTFDRIEPS